MLSNFAYQTVNTADHDSTECMHFTNAFSSSKYKAQMIAVSLVPTDWTIFP